MNDKLTDNEFTEAMSGLKEVWDSFPKGNSHIKLRMYYVSDCIEDAINKLEESKIYSSTIQIDKCLREAVVNIEVAMGYLTGGDRK